MSRATSLQFDPNAAAFEGAVASKLEAYALNRVREGVEKFLLDHAVHIAIQRGDLRVGVKLFTMGLQKHLPPDLLLRLIGMEAPEKPDTALEAPGPSPDSQTSNGPSGTPVKRGKVTAQRKTSTSLKP